MGLQDFFSREADKAIQYFKELGWVLLSPRRFLLKVAAEDFSKTVRRLVLYTLGFAVFEIAVLKAAVPRTVDVGLISVLGVALFEAAFSLSLLPVFLVVTLLARVDQPVKCAFVYSLSSRYLLLTPAIIFYGLFLLTEDYSFALIKGVLGYGFTVVYVFVLPIGLPTSIRRRALAVLVALLTFVLTIGAWGLLISRTSTASSTLEQNSVLYDPIGAEVDSLHLPLRLEEQAPLRSIISELGTASQRALDDLRSKLNEDLIRKTGGDFTVISSQALREWPVTDVIKTWPQTRDHLLSFWEKDKARLEASKNAAKFNTTRKFIDLRLQEIVQGEATARAIDLYLQNPSFEGLMAIYVQRDRMQDITIRSLNDLDNQMSLRIWLMRLHLLL